MDENYYIWSFKRSAWWRKGSWGYTNNLKEAEVYLRAEADYLCCSENSYLKPLVVEKVAIEDEVRIAMLMKERVETSRTG